jgi:cytochrome c
MSTRSRLSVSLGVMVLAGCASPTVTETPHLGRVATLAEVEGAVVYEQKCQNCHGEKGAGQPNDRLVGGHGTLTSTGPVRTVGSYWPYATTVFDYVRRAMPYTQPHSLSDDEVYAVTAYLLHLNGIIGEADVMDAQTLATVKMPNRDNFILAYPTRPK